MRRLLVAAAFSLALALSAGCFSTGPATEGDFAVVALKSFEADDGAFCPTSIGYDDVDDTVLLLDYHEGVHRYAIDGTFLGTTVEQRDDWGALSPNGFAFLGGSEAAVVSSVGDAYRMDLGNGALAAWPMGAALGQALTLDSVRGTLVATPANYWGGVDGRSGLLLLDAQTGAPAGELEVPVGYVSSIAYAADLDALLVLDGDHLLVLDAASGDERAWGVLRGGAYSIAWDAGRSRLYTLGGGWGYGVTSYKLDWE